MPQVSSVPVGIVVKLEEHKHKYETNTKDFLHQRPRPGNVICTAGGAEGTTVGVFCWTIHHHHHLFFLPGASSVTEQNGLLMHQFHRNKTVAVLITKPSSTQTLTLLFKDSN